MAEQSLPRPAEPRWGATAGHLLRRPGLVLSGLIVLTVLGWAFAPGLFTSYDPLLIVPAERLQPPSADHLFGTDQLGRDLYARVVYGAALSLRATVLAVVLASVAGALLGTVAGLAGGKVDSLLMRLVDVLLAIPTLLLSLAVITVLGAGSTNIAIAVAAAMVARLARVMRAEVLRIRVASYIEASRTAGARWLSVLVRHVLPNAAGPVIVLATLEFGTVVLQISTLSFLGFGIPPPAPEWGSLVASGRNYLVSAWWLSALPGLTIAAVVLAVNRIARAFEFERGEVG